MYLLKLVLEIFLVIAVFKFGFGLIEVGTYKMKHYRKKRYRDD